MTDKELIALIKDEKSRDQGFNLLVRKYKGKIYWQVRRMIINHEDSDDLVQEIFIKIFRNLNHFREDSSLYTWIYRITVNETLTFIKSKRNRFFMSMVSVEYKLSESLKDDNYFSGNEIQMRLQKAILRLPEKQRLVFNMKYFDEELTFEDLSKILDTSVGSLKASYHHAVKKIEKFIKED